MTDAPRPAPGATAPAAEDADDFVRRIDLRYQLVYSKVTAVALTAWLGVTILAFVALDGWAVATLTAVGALLVALFAMRTVVHLLSRPLHDEVERLVATGTTGRDALLARARALEPRPADFFVSLVDGPLARQRRLRTEAASQSPTGTPG